MEGITEVDRFIFTVVLLAVGFVAMFLVAHLIERAYERDVRRNRPRPKIDRRERDLLGDDWRDRI